MTDLPPCLVPGDSQRAENVILLPTFLEILRFTNILSLKMVEIFTRVFIV